jgi:hypothetical protein
MNIESFFPPPWNPNEHPEKTEGWIEFQRAQSKNPIYYRTFDWIEVEERLPKNKQKILMTYNDLVMEGEFINQKFYHPTGDACAHVNGYCVHYPQEGITHWMPLPEPPR